MNDNEKKTAFLIAAPSSGCGKTTIALSLMNALSKRGLNVQPFKAGPDYLDTIHHQKVCGGPSYNLDLIMAKKAVKETYQRLLKEADAAVIEGVMGLFDGYGSEGKGSSAELAILLDIPVILVLDVSKSSKSAAAMLYGFENFDKRLKIAGVILNFLGSIRHEHLVAEAVKKHCKTEIIGSVYRDENIKISERYLGLSSRKSLDKKQLEKVESQIDIDKILSLCEIKSYTEKPSAIKNKNVLSKKIAVAFDEAFYFYYRENFDILENMGARLVFFSPLKEKSLPEKIDGLYIGGGYPELFAKELSENKNMLREISGASKDGLPVYAECGGLMYLSSELLAAENKSFQMCGVFSFVTKMRAKRQALGYRKIIAGKNSIFLPTGQEIWGHEFRYSEIEKIKDVKCAYNVYKDDELINDEGYIMNNTLASYIHLHFAGNLEFVKGFLK
ncbi:MAG: cobyrinate a,c-diamide synthase [Spirochaetia bacterium]|nr:cobyrinate a,c-diamide synthase [Spirochaetia bacterium]